MKENFKKRFKEGFYQKILALAKDQGYESIDEFRDNEDIDIKTLRREYYEEIKETLWFIFSIYTTILRLSLSIILGLP